MFCLSCRERVPIHCIASCLFITQEKMTETSELSVKTCCQLWEDSDTPPVLKESGLHFRSEQNQQRIDTLIIQARRQFHHRNTSEISGHGQPCKALLPLTLTTENTPRLGFTAEARAWNVERGTQPEETCW